MARNQVLEQEKPGFSTLSYDYIIGKLVSMITNPDPWILKRNDR